jgi:hypothetical protein
MRLTLANALQSRDGTLTKDARIKNGYIDSEERTPNVIKRPGISLVQTTGDGSIPNDIFVLDDVAYVWRESDPPGSPVITRIRSEDEFRDFQVEFEVFNSLGATSSVTELNFATTTFVAITLRSEGSWAPCSNITQWENDDPISSVSGLEGSGYVGLGLHTVALKLESGYYNLYLDGMKILSAEALVTVIPNPTLIIGNNQPSRAAFTNAEFLE